VTVFCLENFYFVFSKLLDISCLMD